MNNIIDWNSTQFVCTLPDYEKYIIRKAIINKLKRIYPNQDIHKMVEKAMDERVCNLNLAYEDKANTLTWNSCHTHSINEYKVIKMSP